MVEYNINHVDPTFFIGEPTAEILRVNNGDLTEPNAVIFFQHNMLAPHTTEGIGEISVSDENDQVGFTGLIYENYRVVLRRNLPNIRMTFASTFFNFIAMETINLV